MRQRMGMGGGGMGAAGGADPNALIANLTGLLHAGGGAPPQQQYQQQQLQQQQQLGRAAVRAIPRRPCRAPYRPPQPAAAAPPPPLPHA